MAGQVYLALIGGHSNLIFVLFIILVNTCVKNNEKLVQNRIDKSFYTFILVAQNIDVVRRTRMLPHRMALNKLLRIDRLDTK